MFVLYGGPRRTILTWYLRFEKGLLCRAISYRGLSDILVWRSCIELWPTWYPCLGGGGLRRDWTEHHGPHPGPPSGPPCQSSPSQGECGSTQCPWLQDYKYRKSKGTKYAGACYIHLGVVDMGLEGRCQVVRKGRVWLNKSYRIRKKLSSNFSKWCPQNKLCPQKVLKNRVRKKKRGLYY